MNKRISTLSAVIVVLLTSTACSSTPPCLSGDCNADAAISKAVKHQLALIAILPEDQVTVQSVDHIVYLSGLVDTERDLIDAGQRAAGVPGVKKVVNNLALSR